MHCVAARNQIIDFLLGNDVLQTSFLEVFSDFWRCVPPTSEGVSCGD